MVYVPRRLFINRCVRCGKPLYIDDEIFTCDKHEDVEVLICSGCYKKLFGKCPICNGPLIELSAK